VADTAREKKTANRNVAVPNEPPRSEPKDPVPQLDNSKPAGKDKYPVYKPPDSALSLWGVLLGVVAAFIYFMQWHAMNQAMQIDQRAWVSISTSAMPVAEGRPFIIPVAVVNRGKTPAKTITMQVVCERVNKGNSPSFNYAQKRGEASTGVLIPNEPSPTINGSILRDTPDPTWVPENLSADDYRKFQAGDIYIASFAQVTYHDVFGVDHWSHFCVFVSQPSAGYIAGTDKCTAYNDVDSN
jgi:hypothetical protein